MATLQMALLELDTAYNKAGKINTNKDIKNLLEGFAADSTRPGWYLARSVLYHELGRNMNFVYLLPDDLGERVANPVTSTEKNGLLQEDKKTGLKIYPNPTDYGFTMVYNTTNLASIRYLISDLLGREAQSGFLEPNTVNEIDAEQMKNGIYFITLIQDNQVLEKRKLIIMK